MGVGIAVLAVAALTGMGEGHPPLSTTISLKKIHRVIAYKSVALETLWHLRYIFNNKL